MSESEEFATIRAALVVPPYGKEPAPPVLDALARIQAHVEALEGALREVRTVADRNYAEPITFTIVEMCDAALAGEAEPPPFNPDPDLIYDRGSGKKPSADEVRNA